VTVGPPQRIFETGRCEAVTNQHLSGQSHSRWWVPVSGSGKEIATVIERTWRTGPTWMPRHVGLGIQSGRLKRSPIQSEVWQSDELVIIEARVRQQQKLLDASL
jgi:hypothetical protein